MSATIDGLRHNGELLVVGADAAPIQVSPFQIIATSKTVHGHPSGTARDVEETLRFAALTGVRPMTESRPWTRLTRPTTACCPVMPTTAWSSPPASNRLARHVCR